MMPCDLTLIWRGDGGVRRLTAVQLIAPVFTRVQLELRCNSLRLVSRAGISSLQSSKCICAGLMKRPGSLMCFAVLTEAALSEFSVYACVCVRALQRGTH